MHLHVRIHVAALAICWLSDGRDLKYRLCYWLLDLLQLDYVPVSDFINIILSISFFFCQLHET